MRACFLFPFLIGAGVYFLSKAEQVWEGEFGVFLHGVDYHRPWRIATPRRVVSVMELARVLLCVLLE
jgi:hypothetical protein